MDSLSQKTDLQKLADINNYMVGNPDNIWRMFLVKTHNVLNCNAYDIMKFGDE